jgi:hypothetical protein
LERNWIIGLGRLLLHRAVVQIGEVTSADIYLPELAIRVEVKSANNNEQGWAYASFGVGGQIKRGKFDYCVFLTFSKVSGASPKMYLSLLGKN